MRILHVASNIWRCNGVMSIIMNYLRHMPEDIRFDVLYFDELDDSYQKELEAFDCHTQRVSRPGLHSFFRDDVDAYLEAHKGEYAAIHIHLPYLASVLAPKARRAGIGRVIVHCHSSRFSLTGSGGRNRILNIPTRLLADECIACGRDAGAVWYGKRAVEDGRVLVLPNAIETDAFRFNPEVREAKRRELGLEDRLVIGHVGTLTTPKNHKFLLRVFAEIHRRRQDVVLLLAGVGALQPEIEAQIKELGLEKAVTLLGNRRDVAQMLQAMDVFIFPSLHEGLPVSVVEAQAAGLPVLMSDAVTDEVCATGARIRRMPLARPAEAWAESTLELAGMERIDTADQVVQAGFDLPQSARWLAEFYQKAR